MFSDFMIEFPSSIEPGKKENLDKYQEQFTSDSDDYPTKEQTISISKIETYNFLAESLW